MQSTIEKKPWWDFLDESLQDLIKQSLDLIEVVPSWKEKFQDYSFLVFPAAKAYEGFLKKVFLDARFITQEDYFGKRFRIGKALNPSLDPHYRDESVYDKIVNYCSDGKVLANRMWDTWRLCRNLVFHWFPDETKSLSFSQAEERVIMIIETMDDTFKGCKIKKGKI